MQRYANPRVYIGPDTNEVILPIARSYGVALGDNISSLLITFTKRSVTQPVPSEWPSFTIKDGYAHFEIPAEFKSNAEDFPKGFYDGVVTINDCEIGNVEMVKAPGSYIGPAKTVDDQCHSEDEWVEPDCDNGLTEPQTTTCGETCTYQGSDNCPTCYNEQIVAKIAAFEYAGLDEIDPEVCPLPEGSEEVELCDSATTDCGTSSPTSTDKTITNTQEATKEGYIEDDNNC